MNYLTRFSCLRFVIHGTIGGLYVTSQKARRIISLIIFLDIFIVISG